MFDPTDIPSTEQEWDNADAAQRGWEHPERAWIVTDRDVVHRNPYYKGAPVPHPDWDVDECPDELFHPPVAPREEDEHEEDFPDKHTHTEDDDIPF